MQISGIVAEYNPFHRGHMYQITETRRRGATHIVSVMSGHLMQRGDIPVMDKWARTQAALSGGVDLVLELPSPFALGSAAQFARGAIVLLDALGCVNMLSFGCECGSITALAQAAAALDTPAVQAAIARGMDGGLSYPSALAQSLSSVNPEAGTLLSGANNTLAIEYLRALDRLSSPIEALAVKRLGAGHDALEESVFPSASYLRQKIMGDLLPEELPDTTLELLRNEQAAGRAPLSPAPLENALLLKLRQSCPEELLRYEEVGEGLENRIWSSAQTSSTLEELCHSIKVKRYTMARIRRILLRVLFGLTKQDTPAAPPYLRVLGFNTKGREILRKAKTTARLPLIQRAADIRPLPEEARALYRLEAKITNTLSLCSPVIQPGMREYTMEPIRMKEDSL